MCSSNCKLILSAAKVDQSIADIKQQWINLSKDIDWNEPLCLDSENPLTKVKSTAGEICLDSKKMPAKKVAILLTREKQDINCQVFSSDTIDKKVRDIVFMFPGIGDHHACMVGDLYQHFNFYRSNIDRCFEFYKDRYEIDLFYTTKVESGDNTESTHQLNPFKSIRLSENTRYDPLKQTCFAHLFVFAHEYALAKQLISWGVKPNCVVGYSLGEYVAATVAGAIELGNTLEWVATRAQIADTLDKKSMLAIAATASDCLPYFSNSISIAALNSTINLVVAGDSDDIETLKEKLASLDISAINVGVSHAFHTQHMKPVNDWMLSSTKLQNSKRLQIEMITTTDVALRKTNSVLEKAYWMHQTLNPVNFNETANMLASKPRCYIEVGGGAGLTTILKQNKNFNRSDWKQMYVVQPKCYEGRSAITSFLSVLANLWIDGALAGNHISTKYLL